MRVVDQWGNHRSSRRGVGTALRTWEVATYKERMPLTPTSAFLRPCRTNLARKLARALQVAHLDGKRGMRFPPPARRLPQAAIRKATREPAQAVGRRRLLPNPNKVQRRSQRVGGGVVTALFVRSRAQQRGGWSEVVEDCRTIRLKRSQW